MKRLIVRGQQSFKKEWERGGHPRETKPSFISHFISGGVKSLAQNFVTFSGKILLPGGPWWREGDEFFRGCH